MRQGEDKERNRDRKNQTWERKGRTGKGRGEENKADGGREGEREEEEKIRWRVMETKRA